MLSLATQPLNMVGVPEAKAFALELNTPTGTPLTRFAALIVATSWVEG